jgi:hypothetical protein
MLGLGLDYKTIFFVPTPLHLLPVLSPISMQHKAHPSQNGSMKMAATVLNVGQYQSNASTSSLIKNISSLGLPLLSHTVSNAIRTHLTIMRITAPCGRSVAGALPLTMHTMTALFLTTDVS